MIKAIQNWWRQRRFNRAFWVILDAHLAMRQSGLVFTVQSDTDGWLRISTDLTHGDGEVK